jgi:hypothetical protein
MNRRKLFAAVAGASLVGVAAFAVIEGHHAVLRDDDDYDDDDEGGPAAVVRALTFAKVNLQQGLTASELEGHRFQPNSKLPAGTFNCRSTRPGTEDFPKYWSTIRTVTSQRSSRSRKARI